MRTARVLFALCFFVCVVLLCLSCAFLFVLCFFVWVVLLCLSCAFLFELCFFVWLVMLFCLSCAFLFALRFFVCAFSAYVLRFKIYVRFLSLNLFFCAFSFSACVSPFGPKPWCLWMPLHAASKLETKVLTCLTSPLTGIKCIAIPLNIWFLLWRGSQVESKLRSHLLFSCQSTGQSYDHIWPCLWLKSNAQQIQFFVPWYWSIQRIVCLGRWW